MEMDKIKLRRRENDNDNKWKQINIFLLSSLKTGDH